MQASSEQGPTAAEQGPTEQQQQRQQQQQQAMAAMQETLAVTPPAAMAQTASAVAVSPPMGPLPPPTLTDCILCDHASTQTLFSQFFQAAHASNAYSMDMTAAALAVELRLHSQAENVVLYPVLRTRLGQNGVLWATRALAEHAMIEQSVADILSLRTVGGEALTNRMKQLQTEFLTHQAEEENQILPAVAAVLSAEDAVTMAASFKSVKQTAPLMPQTPAAMAAQAVAAGPAPPNGTATGVGAGPGTITTGAVPTSAGMAPESGATGAAGMDVISGASGASSAGAGADVDMGAASGADTAMVGKAGPAEREREEAFRAEA